MIFRPPFIILTLFVAASLLISGCSKTSFTLAKQKHERGEYFDAAAEYRKVYANTPAKERASKGEIAFRMGLCYKQLNQHSRAALAFQNAIRYQHNDTLATLYLAQMLHAQGKYSLAAKQYETYLGFSPNSQLAKNGLIGTTQAPQWRKHPIRYVVKREILFNSRRAEFSPVLAGENHDQLYFTSSNDKFSKEVSKSAITGLKDNDIFWTRKDEKGKWILPTPIEGELNSEYDEGAVSISADGQQMYLTMCQKSEQMEKTAEIFRAVRSGGKWNKPTAFPIWSDTSLMAAHPSISPQGDYLYFVSDKIGGHGGKDIYRMQLDGESKGRIENLGPTINTEGDEMFPMIRDNGELYFSSNGHPGMGGLDLFRAKPTEEGSWMVENMKYPINSPSDDFGITFAGENEEGFFSSNRNDARGWDHIYHFTLPSISVYLEGFVVDQEDNIIPTSTLRIVGNDGSIQRTKPKTDGTYKIKLSHNTEYVMQATATGFLSNRYTLSTFDKEKDTLYVHDFILTPISRPVIVENIFYAFNRAEILPESADALDQIVTMMNEHPNIRIEMGSHTDRKGTDEYNNLLSLRRAQSVVDYLIGKGISRERLTSKGYGKTVPKTITKKDASKFSEWLKEGDILTQEFIDILTPEQQEEADQLNRRTEFTVIDTQYKLR